MQLLSLIGKKTYQKQGFLQDGKRVPLTGVFVSGNFVTQIKTQDKEGYNSLQLGIGTNKKAKKRIVNHTKKAGLENTPRFLKEIKVETTEGATLGSEVNYKEIFAPGDMVDVTGTSKGKGWAGGVKRYGFRGGPRTHGQSDRERAPGSIGQTTTPGRVYKGKKMAGRMGSDTVTVKNLEVISVTDDGMLLIKGLVPGFVGSFVVVKKVGENKKHVDLYQEPQEAPIQEPQTPEDQTPAPVEEKPQEPETPVVVKEASQPEPEPEPEPEPVQETKSNESKEEVVKDAAS
ncbi:MAG: 50S ribosomal protein L3 [Candidatus Levybacteria bacterium]|nr:50S ribosomal protein L3 [Candidatus Levybacteria bacterium]